MRIVLLLTIALMAAACGGAADLVAGQLEVDEEAFDPAANAAVDALATLVVGDTTYTWEGNQWTSCTIDGIFPASADFQIAEDKWSADWVQFIDRGDGGINFSAYLGGEEYSGTGSGEADEISSNGFTYTGDLNSNGEIYETTLEVDCG